jgi:hypothetical protein
MSSEPIRFVAAVWVKAQHVVRYSVLTQQDLQGFPEPRSRDVSWLPFVMPSESPSNVKARLAAETHVPESAIALVEVADA